MIVWPEVFGDDLSKASPYSLVKVQDGSWWMEGCQLCSDSWIWEWK